MAQERKEKVVITVNEAAKLLGISRGSAYEAIRRNQIPNIRIGRRIIVPVIRLNAMLSGNSEVINLK